MFQIFIDGEEIVCDPEFSISEEFMNTGSIELSHVYPKSWKGTNKLLTEYYYPEDYSKCKILKAGELYFTGIVKNTADMELNPFKPHYCSVQILDPSTLLSEGTTLDFVITNKTVEDAIYQVINAISDYGFVAGTIDIPEEENTVIGAYSTMEKAPFDVFQYFSQISGTRWGTHMVDENTTAIDFYSPELLDNSGTIEVTKEYCTQNKIIDITYDYSTTDYRNKQIITSDQVFANIDTINTIISNGYDSTFTLEQNVGRINSIIVNNVEKTFATKTDKNNGIVADFYYEVGSNQIESEENYESGNSIVVNYTAMVLGREITYNNSEVSRIQSKLGRNGTISRYENRTDVTSSSELQAVSRTYIKYNSQAEISVNITSSIDFLKLGSKYQFTSPLNKLNGEYLVKSKNTNVFQSGEFIKITYEYELSNNFDTENELNYFDNQRAKSNGNISQGEYITRNIDIENSISIVFSDLTIQEITSTGSNVLDFTLDSPFLD